MVKQGKHAISRCLQAAITLFVFTIFFSTRALAADVAPLTKFPKVDCKKPDVFFQELTEWQEKNLKSLQTLTNTELISNEIRITSASLLSDKLSFIASDQECASHFFETFSIARSRSLKNLAKKDIENLKDKADQWMNCLEGKHPELLPDAKKIRACFP